MSTWIIFTLYISAIFLIYGAITNIAEQIVFYKLSKNRSIQEIKELIALQQIYKNRNNK